MPYISESEYSFLLSSLEQKSELLQNKSLTIATLTALLREAGAIIKDNEWALDDWDMEYYCPSCGGSKEDGHMLDCRAADIQKRIQEAVG